MSEVTKPAMVDDSMRDRLVEISKTPCDANMDNAAHDFAALARAMLSILETLDKDLPEAIVRG